MEFLTRWGRKYSMRNLVTAYQHTFRSPPSVRYVLPDLADYCRAAEEVVPLGTTDPFEIGRYVGRNDVWRHIQHLTNNEADELELYATVKGKASLKPQDFSHVNASRSTNR